MSNNPTNRRTRASLRMDTRLLGSGFVAVDFVDDSFLGFARFAIGTNLILISEKEFEQIQIRA